MARIRCSTPVPTRTGGARRRGGAAIAAAVLGAAGLAGCSASGASGTTTSAPAQASASSRTAAFYVPPRPLPAAAPGTLIRSAVVRGVPGVPSGATVWRILFHSTTITGADEAESGYVIAPPASDQQPAGGRPVVAWAHGTSGFAAPCAPSLLPTTGAAPYLLPGLDRFLAAGFVVAAADYQGLGVADGVHPYLLGDSEGRAVLDATRAARHLLASSTADRILIYGHSQGGHAALFAGEMAPTYAPDLHVLGVVAAAPATGLSTLISVIATPVGSQFLPYSIPTAWSWSQTYPDLPAATIFTPAGEAFAAREVTHGCSDQVAAAIAAQKLRPTDVFRPAAAADPHVVARARANDPGRVRTTAPVLIVQGTADGTVPPALTDTFVTTMACPVGDTVEYLHAPGATHETVVLVAAPTIVSWMTDRLAGVQPPSTCSAPGAVGVLGQPAA